MTTFCKNTIIIKNNNNNNNNNYNNNKITKTAVFSPFNQKWVDKRHLGKKRYLTLMAENKEHIEKLNINSQAEKKTNRAFKIFFTLFVVHHLLCVYYTSLMYTNSSLMFYTYFFYVCFGFCLGINIKKDETIFNAFLRAFKYKVVLFILTSIPLIFIFWDAICFEFSVKLATECVSYVVRPVMIVDDPNNIFSQGYPSQVATYQPAATNLANAMDQVNGTLSKRLFPSHSCLVWYAQFVEANFRLSYDRSVFDSEGKVIITNLSKGKLILDDLRSLN